MCRACALFAIALAGAAALADTVTIGSAKDNTLYEDVDGAISNGSGVRFFAGNTAAPLIRRGLIEFDVATAVPAGSVITNVSMRLRMSKTIAGPEPVVLHRVLKEWGEGASNATGEEGAGIGAEPGDATWQHTFYPDQFWDNDGGDFSPAPSAVTLVDQLGFYTWSSPEMAADVQNWVDDPESNHGWVLIGDESTIKTAKRFDTRETSLVNNRPALTIEYLPGSQCVGDVDGDGDTDQSDLGTLLGNFGLIVPPNEDGDLDGDGFVGQTDLGTLLGDFPCE